MKKYLFLYRLSKVWKKFPKMPRIPGFFLAAAVAGSAVFFSFSAREYDMQAELSGRLLRFRVLANSDSTADQLQKNKVSAELASLLRPLLAECDSKEEARVLLLEALPAIEQKAAELAAQYGAAYPVACTLAPHTFPLKIYQDLTFPAGTYDTFLVTIGSGKGSNWWCLAYPPLCFAEEAYVTVPERTNETLQNILTAKTYHAISCKQKPSFGFGLLSFLNDWF